MKDLTFCGSKKELYCPFCKTLTDGQDIPHILLKCPEMANDRRRLMPNLMVSIQALRAQLGAKCSTMRLYYILLGGEFSYRGQSNRIHNWVPRSDSVNLVAEGEEDVSLFLELTDFLTIVVRKYYQCIREPGGIQPPTADALSESMAASIEHQPREVGGSF